MGTELEIEDFALKALDYLAWCRRCLSKERFTADYAKAMVALGEDSRYAEIDADRVWASIFKIGIIATYQDAITDATFIKAFTYALSNGIKPNP